MLNLVSSENELYDICKEVLIKFDKDVLKVIGTVPAVQK